MKKQVFVIVALLTVYLVWGSTFLGIRVGMEGGFPPLLLIGLRFLLAGSLLYGFARWSGESRGTWKDWKESALLGFLLLVCGPGLVAWSEQWLTSSLAALLVSTSPVWVTLLDGKETFTRSRLLGVGLGLLGVAWLVGASLTLSGHNVLLGVAACLASALAWAVGSLRAHRRPQKRGWVFASGLHMLFAGAFLSALGLVGGERLALTGMELQAWLALGYLTIFGSVVAFGAYTWLLNNTSPGTLSTHAYVNPVVAVFLGFFLGGETLSQQAGVGAVLALFGVLLLAMPSAKSAKFVG
ncbi:MAG: EamA family transporter [Vulcanimicrobiota bacterium]